MSSENSMSNPIAECEALGISAQTPLVQGDIVSGRVVEVVAQQSIQNASGKWVALVADGKPYEFGTQTHKTTLFVEPINAFGNDLAAQQRALVVFGDISGSVSAERVRCTKAGGEEQESFTFTKKGKSFSFPLR